MNPLTPNDENLREEKESLTHPISLSIYLSTISPISISCKGKQCKAVTVSEKKKGGKREKTKRNFRFPSLLSF